MELNGLSVEQAPPISAPMRFYLTAPLFAFVAGLLIFFSDSSLLMSRYSNETITITHSLTIGFLGFIMLGSLTQMLPVLAGTVIPKAGTISKISHLFLTLGLFFMLYGLHYGNAISLYIAMVLLFFGFMLMLSVIAMAFFKVKKLP